MTGCAIHSYHSPTVAEFNSHHIVPLSWGGQNVSANRIELCPTGHINVHVLLDEYVKADDIPKWSVRKRFGGNERALALRAWTAYLSDPVNITPVRTT